MGALLRFLITIYIYTTSPGPWIPTLLSKNNVSIIYNILQEGSAYQIKDVNRIMMYLMVNILSKIPTSNEKLIFLTILA